MLFVVLFTALLIRVNVAQESPPEQAKLGAILIVLSMIPAIQMSVVLVWELGELISADRGREDTKGVMLDEEGGPQEIRGVAGAAAALDQEGGHLCQDSSGKRVHVVSTSHEFELAVYNQEEAGQNLAFSDQGESWFAAPLVCLSEDTDKM